MSFDVEEFRNDFVIEASDMIDQLESGLLSLLEEPDDEETVNSLFRAAHTIKGGAGTVMMPHTERFTHQMENVLDGMRSGDVEVTESTTNKLLEGVDTIRAILQAEADGEEPEESEQVTELLAAYAAICGAEAVDKAIEKATAQIAKTVKLNKQLVTMTVRVYFRFSEDAFERGLNPTGILNQLSDMGELTEVNLHNGDVPTLDELDSETLYTGWEVLLRTGESTQTIKDLFAKVGEADDFEVEEMNEDALNDRRNKATAPLAEILVQQGTLRESDAVRVLEEHQRIGEEISIKAKVTQRLVKKALKQQKSARKQAANATIRVDTTKLDALVNTVGELVIEQARLQEISGVDRSSQTPEEHEETAIELRRTAEGIERLARDLQQQVLSVRMVPIANTLTSFRRVVHDLSRKTGKNVRLVVEGGETEVDKNVIERLADPLKHMVRNSMDHGIEDPETRLANGKPEQATVTLRAMHQDGQVIVEIGDDGAGLNEERIYEKAVERGLVAPGTEMTAQEQWQLILQPGFSTAESVSDLSGRGVGMDVVRSNLEELGGTIHCESKRGQGTKFQIRLPLTLAIIDGMIVQIGARRFVIPLLSVIESFQPIKGQIVNIEGQGEIVRVREDILPLMRLHRAFRVPDARTVPEEALLIVVDSDGERAALQVDEVLGMQSVVVKALSSYLPRLPGVSAATILGDGGVAVILDVKTLIDANLNNAAKISNFI